MKEEGGQMYIKITREMLCKKEACDPGLDLFDSIAPSGEWEGEWTVLHSLYVIEAGYGWRLHDRNIAPVLMLKGANLQGANLQGANLQGANLQGANLQGANLLYAILTDALTDGADFTGAIRR
jgi:uncharacterized protein YjbI with pentapeptide repeats